MNEKQTSIDWKFWRRWVLFSTLGYGIGGFVGWAIFNIGGWFYLIDISMFMIIVVEAAIIGIAVGLAQWQAVRLKAPQASKLLWVGGNVVGLAISWTFNYWISLTMGFTFLVIGATGILWGLLSTTLLWYVLRGQLRHSVIWFALSSLSGILVLGVGWSWAIILSDFFSNPGIGVDQILYFSVAAVFISWFIAGLLYGLVTGTLLNWVLRGANQPDELHGHVLAG